MASKKTKKAKRAKRPGTRAPAKSATKKVVARQASIVAPSGADVRDDVLGVVAQVSGKSKAEVGGNALSKLAFPCNATFTDRISFQLNTKWSGLNPRFGPADVTCSDTVDSLTREVETRLG